MRKPYFAQKMGRGADIAPSGSWELIIVLKTTNVKTTFKRTKLVKYVSVYVTIGRYGLT